MDLERGSEPRSEPSSIARLFQKNHAFTVQVLMSFLVCSFCLYKLSLKDTTSREYYTATLSGTVGYWIKPPERKQ